MPTKRKLALVGVLGITWTALSSGQTAPDRDILDKIRAEGLQHSQAVLVFLLKPAGHGLRSVSPGTASLRAAGANLQDQRDKYFLVPSRPETVTWGWFPIDKPPVLTIQSGQTVRIDTLSHAGATQDENPVTFLGSLGVEPKEILQDVLDFWASKPGRPREGRGGHILTGPIHIDRAEPGDMLEVQSWS